MALPLYFLPSPFPAPKCTDRATNQRPATSGELRATQAYAEEVAGETGYLGARLDALEERIGE